MKHWTTEEGVKIPINKLEDSHLLNILKMLIRVALHNRIKIERAYLYSAFGGPNGEMAQDAFEREFDQVLESTTEDYLPDTWEPLSTEAERRGLKVPELPNEAWAGCLSLIAANKK